MCRRDRLVAGALGAPEVWSLRPATDLVLTVDTLIAGIHFPTTTHVEDIGHKALAVNVSDLAAMGAVPTTALISITTPEPDPAWERVFFCGLRSLAEQLEIRLGSAVRAEGALAITVFLYGELPPGQGLRRSGACPGDLIYVTGTLGDAALALLLQTQQLSVSPQHQRWLEQRLSRPTPRLAEGIALRDVASAAIDLSDGLSADLGHVLAASNVGASIEVNALPLSAALRGSLSGEQAVRLALAGGDDYELCFTIAPQRHDALQALWKRFDSRLSCIGVIEAQPGLRCVTANGSPVSPPPGYRHFG